MCEITTKETSKGNWHISCKISGKPISTTDQYGMWCEDKCDRQKYIDTCIHLPDGTIDQMGTLFKMIEDEFGQGPNLTNAPSKRGRS